MGFEDLFKSLDGVTAKAGELQKNLQAFTDVKNQKKMIDTAGNVLSQGWNAVGDALVSNPTIGGYLNDAGAGLAGAITLADRQSDKVMNNMTDKQLQEKYDPRMKQILAQHRDGQIKHELAKRGADVANKKSKPNESKEGIIESTIKNLFTSGAQQVGAVGAVQDEILENLGIGQKKAMADRLAQNNANINKLTNRTSQTAAGNSDVFRNSLTETGASVLGGLGRLEALGAEGLERLGLVDEKSMSDRVKENDKLIDRGKRAIKNNDFLSTYTYDQFDPETMKYWDPEVKQAFFNRINHPDIDFHEEAQKAKEYREKEESTRLIQRAINSGKMTQEEGLKYIQAQEAGISGRRLGSEIFMDPLNTLDVLGAGSKIIKGANKAIDSIKEADELSKIKRVDAVIDHYDPKLASQVVDQHITDLSPGEVLKNEVLDTSKQAVPIQKLQKDYSKIIESQNMLDKAFDSGKLPADKYTESAEYLAKSKNDILNTLNNYGIKEEHILKSPQIDAITDIQKVKQANPGITNQDAVSDIMKNQKITNTNDIINKSDDIVINFMSKEGFSPDPVMQASILNKEPVMYTPPPLKINEKGVLQHDINNLSPQQPVQLQFTNSMQRLLYEFSAPYNKAIGSAMGFKTWDQYKESMRELNNFVIQPLAQSIFGDAPTTEQVAALKKNLGAIKSSIDKAIAGTENTPGRIINVGELPEIGNMINDLVTGNVGKKFRASGVDYFTPVSSAEDTVFQVLNSKVETELTNLMNNHGLTREEAQQLVALNPVIANSRFMDSPGIADHLSIAINEGLMAPGPARELEKKSVLSHEKLHVAINSLYDKGVGDILEKKMEVFETKLPPKARQQFEGLFELLDPPTASDFLQEVSAYTRQYRILSESQDGMKIIGNYDIMQFIHNNPELRKELFKWDDMMKVQEDILAVDKGKIIRESQKLKPGEIPTRQINLNSYTDNSSNHEAMLYDEVNRQDRLKQLLGSEQLYHEGRPIVFRGEDDLYNKARIDKESDDAMLGPGHYSSSSYDQASLYTGVGGYNGFSSLEKADPTAHNQIFNQMSEATKQGKNPQLYQEAIELEKPLFWDEKPKSDIMNSFRKTKDVRLQEFLQYLKSDPYYIKSGTMSDMMNALPNYADEYGISRSDMWDVFKSEILDPNGYDGMISQPTDNTGGYEFVNFNLHQVKRATGKDGYGFNTFTNLEY